MVIFLTRGIIIAYQARNMRLKNAKNLGLWPYLDVIVENPGDKDSLRFAAGVGHSDVRFKEVKSNKGRAGPNWGTELMQKTTSATEIPHLSLGTLQHNIAPLLTEPGDRAKIPGMTREGVVKRQKEYNAFFKKDGVSAGSDTVSRIDLPECTLPPPGVHDVAAASIKVMNPLMLTDRRVKIKSGQQPHQVTAVEMLLVQRCARRIDQQANDGTSDSPCIDIPFRVFGTGDTRVGRVAATEWWPCPSMYDPGYTYHFVTMAFTDGETLQLLVVTKKTAIALRSTTLGFLEQGPGGVYRFRNDNVFVWAMPPIKNADRKLAKTVYGSPRGANTGFSAAAWAYFANDHLVALMITSENFEDVRDILSTEVLKVIDYSHFQRRARKPKVNHGGFPILLGAEARLTQRVVAPLLSVMGRKLSVSFSATAPHSLCGMLSSWREQLNKTPPSTGHRLDIDKFLFTLAYRKELEEQPVRLSIAKKSKGERLPPRAVTEKIFGVWDEESVSEFPPDFPKLVLSARLDRNSTIQEAAAEADQMNQSVVLLKLDEALRKGRMDEIAPLMLKVVRDRVVQAGIDLRRLPTMGKMAEAYRGMALANGEILSVEPAGPGVSAPLVLGNGDDVGPGGARVTGTQKRARTPAPTVIEDDDDDDTEEGDGPGDDDDDDHEDSDSKESDEDQDQEDSGQEDSDEDGEDSDEVQEHPDSDNERMQEEINMEKNDKGKALMSKSNPNKAKHKMSKAEMAKEAMKAKKDKKAQKAQKAKSVSSDDDDGDDDDDDDDDDMEDESDDDDEEKEADSDDDDDDEAGGAGEGGKMTKAKAAVPRPVRVPVNPPEEVPVSALSPASEHAPEPYAHDEEQVVGSGEDDSSSGGSSSSEDSSDDELA